MMTHKFCRLFVVSTLCFGIIVVFKMKNYTTPKMSSAKKDVYNKPDDDDHNTINRSSVDRCQPTHQVVFLKVHKAGSSTLMNIIARYGVNHNLVFALPRGQNYVNRLGPVNTSVFLPPPPGRKYDLLCNHAVYNRTVFRSLFPQSTKYLGVLREPFSQFISAFRYYGVFRKVGGFYPVRTFLMYPERYKFKTGLNFVQNRMIFDLGLDSKYFNDDGKVSEHIKMVERDFDLILILENFEESLVLLRRRFCWTVKDILSLPLNIHQYYPFKYAYSFQDHSLHRDFAKADYALYTHFLKIFWRYVFEYGPDFFEEVTYLRNVIERVKLFCAVEITVSSPERTLSVSSSKWNSPFNVTTTDCRLIKMPEMKMMALVRKLHAQASSTQ